MKIKLIGIIIIIFYFQIAYSQQYAITENGEKVILYDDGTWKFEDNTSNQIFNNCFDLYINDELRVTLCNGQIIDFGINSEDDITYNSDGTVSWIGSNSISYNSKKQIIWIGLHSINYNNDDQISWIDLYHLTYNTAKQITSIGNYYIYYNSNGQVTSIDGNMSDLKVVVR